MSDYHLVVAGSDGAALGSFDAWPAARDAWRRVRNKQSVRLLSLASCGCLYQAIRANRHGTHSGWRRVEACETHAPKAKPSAKKSSTARR
jgi:hypothetical protein